MLIKFFIVSYIHVNQLLNFAIHAVPGPPTNLVPEPSLDDCTQVTLRWNPPLPDEQNGVVISLHCD